MKRICLDRCAASAVAAAALVSSCVCRAASINVIDTVTADGYVFTNFSGPAAGSVEGSGTYINGISNAGVAVGYDMDTNSNLSNFTVNPTASTTVTPLNINNSVIAQAFGVNLAGTVVGTDGSGNAFIDSGGTVATFVPNGGVSAAAYGINDLGAIVGQYTDGPSSPGFIRTGADSYITINSPTAADVVTASGINSSGLIAGYYLGSDGQDHGFTANESAAQSGTLTTTAVSDPTVPAIPNEPGATFVFAQLLGVNDLGIVAGYYGDSTASQHGFLYDSSTRQYEFLDDPDARYSNGVEVTEITGINDSGEIAGFYSDANGVFEGFVATPVPEPQSLAALGILGSLLVRRRCARSHDRGTASRLAG